MKDRVRCIDDDRDQAEMLGATLEHLGYVATVTTSPSEAIELVRHELLRLREAIGEKTGASKLVGESSQMRAVSDLIARIAKTDASVLICGETGTGKELVAHAVHASSGQKEGPFVAINCAAVPPNLLESELFGHVRGAFTDAKATRQKLFLETSNNTLFLDEIGEMPLGMQVKLLRAIQERKVRPVGANSEVAFDSRIVTATHRDMPANDTNEILPLDELERRHSLGGRRRGRP
jgi:DNA-binding NtrC family response regulator